MEEKIKKLKKQEENIKTKFFTLSLKLVFIFGAPAFLAAFIGTRMDKQRGGGDTVTMILLGVAFIVSWFITIYMQKKITKEFDNKRNEILELKKNGGRVDTEM